MVPVREATITEVVVDNKIKLPLNQSLCRVANPPISKYSFKLASDTISHIY